MRPNEEIPSIRERLAEVFRRLERAAPADSFEEAYLLLCATVDQVEDELTGLPNEPADWKRTPRRLYPPKKDRMSSIEGADIKRFDSLRHSTYIAANGAIEIQSCSKGQIMVHYSKRGSDGRSIGELCPQLRYDK